MTDRAPAPARRRRPHPAAVARTVVAGLSTTTAFGLIAGFALADRSTTLNTAAATPAPAPATAPAPAVATTVPRSSVAGGTRTTAPSPAAVRPGVRGATAAVAPSAATAAAPRLPSATRSAPVTVSRGS